jgi:hypothetical protein
VDFDEHVLLQFREPGVGSAFVAATLVFNQPSGGQNYRIILGVIGGLDRLVASR